MSQAKVDKYKQEKANRQQTMKKEKLIRRIELGVVGALVIGLGVWIGVSTFNKVEDATEQKTVYFDVSALNEYMESLVDEEE